MKELPARDTFTALRVMYHLPNPVGLAPFAWVTEESPSGRKHKKFIPSRYGRLHTIFMILIVTTGTAVMMVWKIAYSYHREKKGHSSSHWSDRIIYRLRTGCCVSNKCVREHHHSLSRMLTSISRGDKSLLYPCEEAWKNTEIFQASQCIYFLIDQVFFYFFQYNVWAKEHGSMTRNHISLPCVIHAVICVTEIQYFNLVSILKRRFFILNSRFNP